MYQCFTVIRDYDTFIQMYQCVTVIRDYDTFIQMYQRFTVIRDYDTFYSDVPVLYSYLRDTVIFKIERIVLFFMGGCFLCFVDILDAKQPCSRGIRIKSQELLALDK